MPTPTPGRRRTLQPIEQALKETRRGLLRLHKALVDTERAAFESREGPMSNGQFLQALIQDPFFEWLRPMSALIVEVDEALAEEEPVSRERVHGYLERIEALTAPEADTYEAKRLAEARERGPAVAQAQQELATRLTAARES